MTVLFTERERYVKMLEQDLNSLVRQLSAIPKVEKIVLFGSYAAGRRDLFTDLDLLVVMHSPLDFASRCVELARCLQAGVALDLLVYTPREIERMRSRPFLRHILKTGKVLYEKERSL